jgi:chromosome segregation ATPase
LNEMDALARVFGIPLTQFLEPGLLLDDGDGLRELDEEITRLTTERARLAERRDAAEEHLTMVRDEMAAIWAELSRVNASLNLLSRWRSQAGDTGEAR